MRRAVPAWVAVLPLVALAGCASGGGAATSTVELTRIGEAVQVTDNEVRARECEFVSDLTVRSADPSDDDALRMLRNDAGAAGANLVLLVMEGRTTVARAEGYLCADE